MPQGVMASPLPQGGMMSPTSQGTMTSPPQVVFPPHQGAMASTPPQGTMTAPPHPTMPSPPIQPISPQTIRRTGRGAGMPIVQESQLERGQVPLEVEEVGITYFV